MVKILTKCEFISKVLDEFQVNIPILNTRVTAVQSLENLLYTLFL